MKFKQAYEQKQDFAHITLKIVSTDEQKQDLRRKMLKIVSTDEQKQDLGHITLKIVTGGWRMAGNDESNEESSAENARGRCDGRRNLVFRAPSRKINFFGRGPSSTWRGAKSGRNALRGVLKFRRKALPLRP